MKNISELMKQAQGLQDKMEEMQTRLDDIIVEGQAGAGMVRVQMSAKGMVKGLKIDPSLFKPEDVEIVEDLIVAAHNDAKTKAEERTQSEMQSITGGLSLPPGMKLPF